LITGQWAAPGGKMPEIDDSSRQFARDLYKISNANVLRLKSQLPEDAVGGIINEVLSRVRSRRSANLNSINTPSHQKIELLSRALISDDPNEGAEFIDAVQDEGATLDAIYLSYLAQAARLLGHWWNEDEVSFHQVMIGSSRIYSIIRGLSHLFHPAGLVEVKSATFANVPGETHTLGVQMAADLFRKEGWDIDLQVGRSHDDLVDRLSEPTCRIIGLSAGGVHSAAPLARLLIALRISNPSALIFLSGQFLTTNPEMVGLMDIDGTADDYAGAQSVMDRLWSITLGKTAHA
jgi:methanogenic corrinoid protein MtbC1